LIREVLEDTGAYQPFLFPRPKDALELARKDAVALIVLDAELGAQASPQLLAELREQAPHARLVIIPAEGNPYDPQIRLLRADAILPSPFYLPDLIAAIEQFFGPIVPRDSPRRSTYGEKAAFVPAPIREKARAPDWLEDVSEAAGYLTRLSLESASRAALITKGDKAWAYAGELPTQAADELAAAVAEHTANGNEDDLARFIHLNATGIDYMLYATGLGGDFTLALVFDAQMPFSQMRARVNDLAKALVTAPLEMRNESNTAVQSVGREAGLRGRCRCTCPSFGGLGTNQREWPGEEFVRKPRCAAYVMPCTTDAIMDYRLEKAPSADSSNKAWIALFTSPRQQRPEAIADRDGGLCLLDPDPDSDIYLGEM